MLALSFSGFDPPRTLASPVVVQMQRRDHVGGTALNGEIQIDSDWGRVSSCSILFSLRWEVHMPFKSACFGAAVTALSLFCGPQSARAELLLFTITGTTDATFTLDSNATPNSVDLLGQPTFLNVAGTLNGASFTFADLTFFNGIHSGGGLDLYKLSPTTVYVSLAGGSQVYSDT
jgi:hypothetical protein